VEFFLVLCIQASGWLIGQYDIRPVGKGSCHCYSLFLSSGQFGRLMVGPVGKSQKLQ
jgi:hypothetical protein